MIFIGKFKLVIVYTTSSEKFYLKQKRKNNIDNILINHARFARSRTANAETLRYFDKTKLRVSNRTSFFLFIKWWNAFLIVAPQLTLLITQKNRLLRTDIFCIYSRLLKTHSLLRTAAVKLEIRSHNIATFTSLTIIYKLYTNCQWALVEAIVFFAFLEIINIIN